MCGVNDVNKLYYIYHGVIDLNVGTTFEVTRTN